MLALSFFLLHGSNCALILLRGNWYWIAREKGSSPFSSCCCIENGILEVNNRLLYGIEATFRIHFLNSYIAGNLLLVMVVLFFIIRDRMWYSYFFCVILALMEGPPRNQLYKPVWLDRILGGEVREGTSIQRRMALVLEHEMYFGPIRLCVDSIRASLALYILFYFFLKYWNSQFK